VTIRRCLIPQGGAVLEKLTVAQPVYPYNRHVLVAWLRGFHLLLRDFGPYGIFMNACYIRCRGNAVKGLWTLWDTIYDCVSLLL
jgi:hypothetical protein